MSIIGATNGKCSVCIPDARDREKLTQALLNSGYMVWIQGVESDNGYIDYWVYAEEV